MPETPNGNSEAFFPTVLMISALIIAEQIVSARLPVNGSWDLCLKLALAALASFCVVFFVSLTTSKAGSALLAAAICAIIALLLITVVATIVTSRIGSFQLVKHVAVAVFLLIEVFYLLFVNWA